MLGRKAAVGTELNAAVIRVREAFSRKRGLLGDSGSLPSVPSCWSVGDHKQEPHVPISDGRASLRCFKLNRWPRCFPW